MPLSKPLPGRHKSPLKVSGDLFSIDCFQTACRNQAAQDALLGRLPGSGAKEAEIFGDDADMHRTALRPCFCLGSLAKGDGNRCALSWQSIAGAYNMNRLTPRTVGGVPQQAVRPMRLSAAAALARDGTCYGT